MPALGASLTSNSQRPVLRQGMDSLHGESSLQAKLRLQPHALELSACDLACYMTDLLHWLSLLHGALQLGSSLMMFDSLLSAYSARGAPYVSSSYLALSPAKQPCLECYRIC